MSRSRKLSSEEAVALVLAGLKGDLPLGDLCRQYGVSQATYYKLRDRFPKERDDERVAERVGGQVSSTRLIGCSNCYNPLVSLEAAFIHVEDGKD